MSESPPTPPTPPRREVQQKTECSNQDNSREQQRTAENRVQQSRYDDEEPEVQPEVRTCWAGGCGHCAWCSMQNLGRMWTKQEAWDEFLDIRDQRKVRDSRRVFYSNANQLVFVHNGTAFSYDRNRKALRLLREEQACSI